MDATERARLVERHLDVARRAAYLVHARVRGYVEIEELIALANSGLAEAAHRYDPRHGTTFVTFAWYRIQGAMFDALRKSTHLPRRQWAKLVALRAANEYLEHRAARQAGALQRGAAPPAGAAALSSIHSALSAIRTIYLVSLETLEAEGKQLPAGDAPADDAIDAQRMAKKLRLALDKLPERERALMTKHYLEGKNLLEAGAELGISKSWASRLHAQAVERLRALVDKLG